MKVRNESTGHLGGVLILWLAHQVESSSTRLWNTLLGAESHTLMLLSKADSNAKYITNMPSLLTAS